MLPPLLHTRSGSAEFIAVVVVPLAFGALTGLALGWSEPLYLVLLVLGVLGGIGAGLEHDAPIDGFYRGLLGGLLFTTGILVAHGLADVEPEAHLPDPETLLLLINGTLGAAFGAFGARLRSRRENRAS
jgi:hypothetical protein